MNFWRGRRRRVALMCAPLMIVGACTGGGHSDSASTGAGGGGPVVQLRPSAPPTGAQLAYGQSIGHIPGVTYQPDVVVIGGGASSIRAADGSGLIWTIDGSAPGAGSLHVGSIMVASTLASGRVLQVRNVAGGNRQVVLGPVTLTDVIKDGDFATDGAVALSDPLDYTYPSDPSAQQIPAPAGTDTSQSAHETRLGRADAPGIPVPNPPNVPVPKVPVPKLRTRRRFRPTHRTRARRQVSISRNRPSSRSRGPRAISP